MEQDMKKQALLSLIIIRHMCYVLRAASSERIVQDQACIKSCRETPKGMQLE